MSSSSHGYTSRSKAPHEQQYYYFAGRAYPRIKPGQNLTKQIRAHAHDRQAFYHDPAVVLCEADLQDCKWAEGQPLCIEHNANHVVGNVLHSFLGDGDKRSLKIVGRIPVPQQQHIVNAIKKGDYKALSVSYGTKYADNTMLGKRFREISLVREPFFPGCDLAEWGGVTASKEGTKISNHNSGEQNPQNYEWCISIEASMESSSAPAQSTPTPAPQASAPASTPAPTTPAVQPTELLQQTARLKEQYNESESARKAQEEKMAQMAARLKQLEDEEKKRAAEYAKSQEPKLAGFLQDVMASAMGGTLTKEQEEAYRFVFTSSDPNVRKQCQDFERIHGTMTSVMAAKQASEEAAKKAEERAKLAEEELAKFKGSLQHTLVNNSREVFSAASRQDEPNPSALDSMQDRRKMTDVNAGLHTGDMMDRVPNPAPGAQELMFMRQIGYCREAGVAASANDSFYEARDLPTSFPKAPPASSGTRFVFTEDGEPIEEAMTQSWRHTVPAQFGWLVDTKEFLTGDLTPFSRTLPPQILRKDRQGPVAGAPQNQPTGIVNQ